MCHYQRRRFLAVLVACGLATRVAATGLAAQGRTPPSDQQLQAAVVRQLQDHHLRRGNNPQVSAAGDTVTLSGQMQSLWEKEEAIKQARAVPGVSTLVSDLVIARAESDKAISDALTAKVLHYAQYSVFDDISSQVLNGVVTLDGLVTSEQKADDLADMASRVRGVQALRNNLKTVPVSQSDDRLRNDIARRIFLNPSLENYARQANPSIHIIVAYGRVTLKGFVNSASDKQQIEAIVRDVQGLMKLDNQLQAPR